MLQYDKRVFEIAILALWRELVSRGPNLRDVIFDRPLSAFGVEPNVKVM